jgi:hypothetical protein
MELKWESSVRWDVRKGGDQRWSWVSPDSWSMSVFKSNDASKPYRSLIILLYCKPWNKRVVEAEESVDSISNGEITEKHGGS